MKLRSVFSLLACLVMSTLIIPLVVAVGAKALSPYSAKHPGKYTFANPGDAIPDTVKSFAKFHDSLGLSWDETFLYIETNGLPNHNMMTGITAWQQQVPVAHDYTGSKAFKLPLKPEYLEKPDDLTLMGPIAFAVNGIPIFHALTQSGKDAYAGGELDQWGGHCGRADDYHYHIAPTHLEEIVGKGMPIAYGLDGYPIYSADPGKDKPLDECHGYFDDDGKYRYVGELKPPYVMSYFRGKADLESRPKAGGIRPFLRPLRGAKITNFSGSLHAGYHLEYDIHGAKSKIDYRLGSEGDYEFVFTDSEGKKSTETYQKRPQKPGPKGNKGKGDKKGKSKQKGKGKGSKGKGKGGERKPWIINHAAELDSNGDGKIEFESELLAEVNRVFKGMDANENQKIDSAEINQQSVRSAMNGFIRQHQSELDRNADDGISLEELTREFTKFFRKQDRDKNNQLTQDELR